VTRFIEIISKGHAQPPRKMTLPIKIGGGREASVVIPGINQCVCILGERDGHLYLEPVSESVQIFHNKKKVDSWVWIKSGDTVQVGDYILTFSVSPDLVTINIQKASDYLKGALSPPNQLHQNAQTRETGYNQLPRVENSSSQSGSGALRRLAIPLGLGTLILIAALVLWARGFEVRITPAPDTLEFKGFPPVVGFGKHFIALPFSYEIVARKEGYSPLKETVDLSTGETLFTFRMTPLPGFVDFDSKPQGAQVTLDDTALGKTPIKNHEIMAGNHTCLVALEGFVPVKRQIHIKGFGTHQRFTFDLVSASANVTVTSAPRGAKILVDERDSGAKTPSKVLIPKGSHVVSLVKEGYEKTSVRVKVEPGQKIVLPEIKLSKARPVLRIKSVPPGAKVSVDSVYKGKTPLEVRILPGKKHLISVSAPGHKGFTKRISLGAGEKRELKVRLKPQFGTLFITSDPENLELYIDGKRQERNFGAFVLLATSHTIEARAPGKPSMKTQVKLYPGQKKNLDIRLGQQPLKQNNSSGLGKGYRPPRVVLIRPRAFMMGSSRREQGRRSNEIQRRVILERPFLIGTREVTNRQFRRFRPGHSSGRFAGMSLDGDLQPVVRISWEDAARYCNWLSKQEGLPPFYVEKNGRLVPSRPANTGYRLPTEAEWAFVARVMGRRTPARYPWNGPYPPRTKSGNYADESARGILPAIIKGYQDSFAVTAPVGKFPKNPAGLYDIGGNVSEWCNDYYSPIPVASHTLDPLGPPSGTHHVVRGSSWRDASITELRLAYRGYSRKAEDYIGFRVARYAR